MRSTILIADTISDRRIRLRTKLDQGRYRTVSETGSEGLSRRIAEDKPSLLIYDISCDVTSSIEKTTISSIKARPDCPECPILALVSPNSAKTRLGDLLAGADAVLARDAPQELLLALIRSLLRRADTRAALQRRSNTIQDLGLADPGEGFNTPIRVALVAEEITGSENWARDLENIKGIRATSYTLGSALDGFEIAAPPDIAVIEAPMSYPGAALGLLAELRARPSTRHSGIIIVHDKADIHTATMSLDLGANEILEEGFLAQELTVKIEQLARAKREAEQLRASVDTGLRLALEDPLTGLFNRRYVLAHAQRQAGLGVGYCVVVADLDRFKAINDSFGHSVGDEVLVAIGRRLRENVRSVDMVARIGGEEFLIFLPDPDPVAAESAAQRLCDIIHETPVVPRTGSQSIRVTASFGVAEARAGEPLEDAIKRADEALYAAKKAGRDTVLLSPSCAA
ncbi:diguanylate cyclase [Ovoidimarina sediminis]|uniref:diguanylate cyclase n=1 Tax=Ovoidimarina sediminis TaxID=3079856 RepID=UPI0029121DC1|nr:diguanylate cyclase [Rhodophyticola sp. MJ-SS7]MDU8942125.1 diguanylate cyclase [Rhodophyticola sp. MJ-SS7]